MQKIQYHIFISTLEPDIQFLLKREKIQRIEKAQQEAVKAEDDFIIVGKWKINLGMKFGNSCKTFPKLSVKCDPTMENMNLMILDNLHHTNENNNHLYVDLSLNLCTYVEAKIDYSSSNDDEDEEFPVNPPLTLTFPPSKLSPSEVISKGLVLYSIISLEYESFLFKEIENKYLCLSLEEDELVKDSFQKKEWQ